MTQNYLSNGSTFFKTSKQKFKVIKLNKNGFSRKSKRFYKSKRLKIFSKLFSKRKLKNKYIEETKCRDK